MAISDSRQMAALLTGMSLALCMANRLQAYVEYFQRLSAALTTTNFEKALTNIYAHVLRIIATAIRTYQRNVVTRTWRALWETSTLENFETECDKLGSRAEIEASNCDRELSARDRENATQWKDDLDRALRKLDGIQGITASLDTLHVKIDLTKLVTAEGATHNSYAEGHLAQCLEGTRTEILRQIADWRDDSNGKCIFWLCGMAGTGKSTISRTVADALDKRHRLGASFFFKRGEGDRGNASRFFPTIAIQLANMVPGLSYSIAKALDADSLVCTQKPQEQFEKLLWQPLLYAAKRATLSSGVVVVVIDALDECENREDIRTILRLLPQVEAIGSLNLRVFVTSRPELPIQLGFKTMKGDLHQDVVLEQVQATTIEHDIRTYFRHRFQEIREEDALIHTYDPLPTSWPGDDCIMALIDLAVPLFIFAFTVCRYISERDPRGRLDIILQQRKGMTLSGLDTTYVPILNQMILDRDAQEHGQAIAEFRKLVGPIALLADPLSAASLSSLLEIPLRDVSETLRHLHSVLNIPTSRDSPIRLFHLSFRDFLIDPRGTERKETSKFHIDEVQTHSRLADQCLRRLNRPGTLGKDLCGIQKPGVRRVEITREEVIRSIAVDVAYACCYWALHTFESEDRLCDDGHVHQFLQRHFLHWLEALSWLDRLSSAIAYVDQLRCLVEVSLGQCLGTIEG